VPPLQAQRPDTSANTRLQPPPGPSQSNRVSEYYAQAQRLTGISSPDISSVNTSPRLQPAQPGGRPPNRYTLSDPGAVPTSAGAPSSARVPSPPALKYPARGQSPAGRQGQNNTKYPGGTPPQDEPFTAPVPAQGKKPGPTTFAEMGFSGAKAQDKECIIM
jgi:hypothetical protein